MSSRSSWGGGSCWQGFAVGGGSGRRRRLLIRVRRAGTALARSRRRSCCGCCCCCCCCCWRGHGRRFCRRCSMWRCVHGALRCTTRRSACRSFWGCASGAIGTAADHHRRGHAVHMAGEESSNHPTARKGLHVPHRCGAERHGSLPAIDAAVGRPAAAARAGFACGAARLALALAFGRCPLVRIGSGVALGAQGAVVEAKYRALAHKGHAAYRVASGVVRRENCPSAANRCLHRKQAPLRPHWNRRGRNGCQPPRPNALGPRPSTLFPERRRTSVPRRTAAPVWPGLAAPHGWPDRAPLGGDGLQRRAGAGQRGNVSSTQKGRQKNCCRAELLRD